MSVDTIKAIEARIVDKSGKTALTIKKPVYDAPAVNLDIGSIKMAPPSYKKGEKVVDEFQFDSWFGLNEMLCSVGGESVVCSVNALT